MLSHKEERPFKQYTEGGYSRWQELKTSCTEGGKHSHKEREWEEHGGTSFPERQFPAESLNWLASSLLYILFIWTNLFSFPLNFIPTTNFKHSGIHDSPAVQVRRAPIWVLKAAAFSEVLIFFPLNRGQLGVKLGTGKFSSIFRKLCLSQDFPQCGCPAHPMFLLPI